MSDIVLKSEDINLMEHKHISKTTGKASYQQVLVEDEDTKMLVKQIIYPKGCITPWHTHNCAHGIYVLRGMLHTNLGDFDKGSFVWFKEGSKAFHGGKDEDVEVLFITNKKFDINYL